MKQLWLLPILLLCLAGCGMDQLVDDGHEEPEEVEIGEYKYEGRLLTLAVIGTGEFGTLTNITRNRLSSLDDLLKEAQLDYDAIFITKSAFQQASDPSYASFFNSVDIPVFFVEADEVGLWTFTNKEETLESARIENAGFIQGYWNASGDREWTAWSFPKPDGPEDNTVWVDVMSLIESLKE